MSRLSHILYTVLLPVFFVAFSLLYNPFGICGYYSAAPGHYFHLVMLACIILLTIAISRALLPVLAPKADSDPLKYSATCALELCAASAFMALYTCLFTKEPYFSCLAESLRNSFLILVYPVVILSFIQFRGHESGSDSRDDADSVQGELVKFYDEHQKLKFAIAADAILFVRAEDNYVHINYLDSGNHRTYELRNSMKSLEPAAAKAGLVRCHRSFYVNPRYIKVLRKDKEGFITAEFNLGGIAPVPVSKKYYDQVSSIL